MDRDNRHKIKLPIKRIYIFTLILTIISAFMFMGLIRAADTDNVNIDIPRIEGVKFYRILDSTESEIGISSAFKNISFLQSEVLKLKVEIDDDKYFSGLDEENREKVKAAFSVKGRLAFKEEPLFENGAWNLQIQKSEEGSLNEKNALQIDLTQKQDIFLEFLNSEGIDFFSSDGTENLGGTLKRVKETKSFEFKVKLDTSKINITNPADFKISVGNNEYSLVSYSANNGVYTYDIKIDKVNYSARIEAAELVTLKFEEIQGLTYYQNIGANNSLSNQIQNNTSKAFALGSTFEFYILIDSKVPLNTKEQDNKNNEETLKFYFGNNELTSEYLGNRKYKIVLTDIKLNASLSTEGFYKIWFPPKALGIAYTDKFGAADGTYRTVGKKSTYKFTVEFDAGVFGNDPAPEFSLGTSAIDLSIRKTDTNEPNYEVTLSNIEADGNISINYLTAGFNAYTGVTYYKDKNTIINSGQYFPVLERDSFNFYLAFDTDVIEVGDNLKTIEVKAGSNNVTANITTEFSKEKMKIFKVSVKNVTSSFIIEIPSYLTLSLKHNFDADSLRFFETTDYVGIHGNEITGNQLIKTVIGGSEYSCVARMKKSEVFDENSTDINNSGTIGKLQFSFGEENPTVINKYYVDGDYVYYTLTTTVNVSGSVQVKDAYAVTFENAGAVLGFDYPNGGKGIIKGYGNCTFTINFPENSPNFTPEFLLNGEEPESDKLSVDGKSYTIKNISEDTVVTPVTREINYLSDPSSGYTITAVDAGSISNSDGSKTLKVAKGMPAKFNIVFDTSKISLSDEEIQNLNFRCGNNDVKTNERIKNGNKITFEITVTCTEDAEISVGKSILFPDIYNVNFYECKGNNAPYSLGDKIENGTKKGILPGESLMFFVEVDNSIAVPSDLSSDLLSDMFSGGSNTLVYQNIQPSDAVSGKRYFCYKIEKAIYNSSITSEYLFTVDLPPLSSVYYYTSIDGAGNFSGQLLDNKFTVWNGQTPKYKFYVHFDGTPKGTISSESASLSISQDNTGSDYTVVTIDSISGSSSIKIDKQKDTVLVEMPLIKDCMKTLKYSVGSSSKYEDASGWVIDADYGDEVKLKLSFKADVEGYSNLYKTPYGRISVKVYRSVSSDSSSTSRVLLKTLSLRSLSEDANDFVSANVEYESEAFRPYCDVILEVDGIQEDIYDVNIISGDNTFLNAFTNIYDVIKIKKIENPTGKKADEINVDVPYSVFRGGYLIKSVKYGEELRFKYEFTNGATEEGIKYSLSEITAKMAPYEGDSGDLDVDEDNIYSAVIKTDTEISLSGIKGNQYEITIPTTPDVTVKYVINSETFPSDALVQTAQNNKILVTHGQKILMKISSNNATKRYIRKVTATNTMYSSDPDILYDSMAVKEEVEVAIEEVLGNTELGIEVSRLEHEIQIALREIDKNNKGTYFYPDVDKLYIYDNNTNDSLNKDVNDGDEDSIRGYLSCVVEDGKDFEFRLSLDYKYNKSDVSVSYRSLDSGEFGSTTRVLPNKGVYTISKVRQGYKIFIDDVKMNVYDIEFPQPSEEINFHKIIVDSEGKESVYPIAMNGVVKMTHGETLLFTPVITGGYTLAGDSVKANDDPIRLKNGRYELSNISSDIKITVDPLDKIEYTITFPTTITGVSFVDTYGSALTSAKKKFGESQGFKVVLDSQYNQSRDNIKVYAVGTDVDWTNPAYNPITDSGATQLLLDQASNYNLTSISRDSVIIVIGVTRNQYFIDLPISEEGIVFWVPVKNKYGETEQIEVTEENEKSLSVAVQGENFMFSVTAKDGYDISLMNLTATISGTTIESSIEKMATGYIIQEVSYDYIVKASNINKKYHTVTLDGAHMEFRTNPNSVEVIKSGNVEYGTGEFKFYVTPTDGCVFGSGGLTAYSDPLDGAEVQTPGLKDDGTLDGPVIVKNVTNDVKIKLGGIELKTFTVTLPIDTEGISFMSVGNESSNVSSGAFELGKQNIVEVGTDFKFHIKPDYGYDISEIQVSTGPGEYIYPLDGIYTINKVMKDTEVQVENIKYAKYTIKLRGDNMTFYEPNGLFPQSDFTVSFRGETEFRIVANMGYEIDLEKDISFVIGNEVIRPGNSSKDGISIDKPDENGIFKIRNVIKDISVNVSGAKKKIYNLNFPTNITGAKLKTSDGRVLNAQEKAEYLSEFKFEVVPERGYNTNFVEVTIDPSENGIIKPIDGGYSIQSITGDLTVSVSGIKPNEYMVSYKGMGANFYNESGSLITSSNTYFGGSLTFSLKNTDGFDLLKGYDISIINESGDKATISSPSVDTPSSSSPATQASLPEGTVISESGRFTYTVSNIQGNLTIMIEKVGKSKYSINFPTSVKGITFKDENGVDIVTPPTIDHGLNFVFKIVAEEGYDISNIVVTSNMQSIDFTDNKYTIENITQDIDIEVSGVVSTIVYLSLKYVPGVNYTTVDDIPLSTLERIPVDHGGNYSFKVELDESYSQSKDKMKVLLSPETSVLSFERGIYTLSNITEDSEITVSGVDLNTYKINLTESSGVRYKDEFGIKEIKGTQIIEYGKDFKFIADPDEGYNLSDIEVSVKGATGQRVALTPVDNVYTIPNVTMDYTVVVEKAKKETYTVEIRLSEGATLMDSKGSAMEVRQTVNHGDDLSFRLSIATAYDQSVPVVMVKGRSNPITPENNVYTVKNITGDTIVEVSNIKKNTYKVTFKPVEGVIYRTEKNKDFSGYLEVEYGGTLNFKIAMKDEYDASDIMVMLDGDKVLSLNGGIYQIISISSDCEVSVKYSEKNAEEYVIEMIDALPNKVSTRQQADEVVVVSRAFNDLSEEQQKLVTNLSKLKILQTETSGIHHQSNSVEVSGLDWNIKVVVTPLDGDSASVSRLNEKMQRKTVISHYEISLVNTLSGEKYEPGDNQKISVVLPCNIPKGYMNTVIVHEKLSGSIEYLDVLINNGYAKFETESFSIFGVAAKKIPNYVEKATDITVSLEGITDNEEETKQILSKDLPALLEEEAEKKVTPGNVIAKKNGTIIDDTGGSLQDKILNWVATHEFLVTLILVLIFSAWIFIIISKGKKKST